MLSNIGGARSRTFIMFTNGRQSDIYDVFWVQKCDGVIWRYYQKHCRECKLSSKIDCEQGAVQEVCRFPYGVIPAARISILETEYSSSKTALQFLLLG